MSGGRVDNIMDHLQYVDAETVKAFESAAKAARFACEVMLFPDTYQRSSGGHKKPEGKEPGPHQFGWARKRVLTLLQSVASVEDSLQHRLDMARTTFDGAQKIDRPTGVQGRPLSISTQKLAEIAALKAAGLSVTRIAHAGVIPARTFWGALKRGATEVAGADRELFLAVYGGGER